MIISNFCFISVFRQCSPVKCFAFLINLSSIAVSSFNSNHTLIPIKNLLDVWDSTYKMHFFLVSYSNASAINFSLILYIYGFYLLGLVLLSFSAGLVFCFLQLTAIGSIFVDLVMVSYRRWWFSWHIRFFYVLSISSCMMARFFNILKYLSYIMFNALLNLLFSSKSCSFLSFVTSKKFFIQLISDFNWLNLAF